MSTEESSPSRRQSMDVLLVRFLVGWVFLSEGIQKFLFPAALGAGRFAKIGIPFPQFSGPFVGVVEIVCGSLLIVGFFASWAAIPLLIDIAVAIATTKLPMLLQQGFWAAMHEGRTDFCMLLGLIAIMCRHPILNSSRQGIAGGLICWPCGSYHASRDASFAGSSLHAEKRLTDVKAERK